MGTATCGGVCAVGASRALLYRTRAGASLGVLGDDESGKNSLLRRRPGRRSSSRIASAACAGVCRTGIPDTHLAPSTLSRKTEITERIRRGPGIPAAAADAVLDRVFQLLHCSSCWDHPRRRRRVPLALLQQSQRCHGLKVVPQPLRLLQCDVFRPTHVRCAHVPPRTRGAHGDQERQRRNRGQRFPNPKAGRAGFPARLQIAT